MGWLKGKPKSPETRARMSAARSRHLAHLTPAQVEAYRLYRRKGCPAAEAIQLAQWVQSA